MGTRGRLRAYPPSYWDAEASGWDRVVTNPRNPHQFYYREADIHISRTLDGSMQVLEVGCGTGGSTEVHCRDVSDLVATDFSWGMVRRARRRIRKMSPQIPVVRCDASHLPFRRSSFDAVFSRGVLISYVPQSGRFLAEARRVLRRGGRLAIDAMNRIESSKASVSRGFHMVSNVPAYVELCRQGAHQVRRVSFLLPRSRFAPLARKGEFCRSKPKGIDRDVTESVRYEARLFSPRELRSLVAGAGFRQVQIVPMGHFAYLLPRRRDARSPCVSEFTSRHAERLAEVGTALADHLRPETALHLMVLAKRS